MKKVLYAILVAVGVQMLLLGFALKEQGSVRHLLNSTDDISFGYMLFNHSLVACAAGLVAYLFLRGKHGG